MTTNSESPESGSNSQNTNLQNVTRANKLIEQSIKREFNEAISSPTFAKEFINKHLSTKEKAVAFVESIWKDMQKGETIPPDSIDESYLKKIAQKLRVEFITKAKSFEKNRNDIKNAIVRTYQLNEAQIAGINTAIADIPSQKLNTYFSASRQRELLKRVCEELGQNVPVTLGAYEQLIKIFWRSATKKFDNETVAILVGAYNTGDIKSEDFVKVWGGLTENSRAKLLAVFSVYLPLHTLQEADASKFSTNTLKAAVRTQIQTSLPDDLKKEDINAALGDLEWSDIRDLYINEDTIINLLKNAESPFPEKLIVPFRKWLLEQVEAAAEEKDDSDKSSQPGESTVASSQNNESIASNWYETIITALSESDRKTLKWWDLLQDENFLSGKEALILTSQKNNQQTIYKIRVVKNQNDKNWWSTKIHITELGEGWVALPNSQKTLPILGFGKFLDTFNTLEFEKDTAVTSQKSIDTSKSTEDTGAEEIEASATEDWSPEDDTEILAEDLGDPPADILNEADIADTIVTPPREETQDEQDQLPNSLDSFNKAVSEKMGTAISLTKNDCISIGKPGTEKYNVYRIKDFTETGIIFWNNSQTTPEEEVSFADLYEKGVKNETAAFKVLENKLETIEDLLGIMQQNSTQKALWKELEVTRDNKDNPIFDFVDRRFDSIKTKKQYFPGNDGKIIEIISIDNGKAHIRVGEEFQKSNKSSQASTAKWFQEEQVPLQYLVLYMTRFSCAPWNEPPREIASRAVPEEAKTTSGKMKSIFGRLSAYDIMSGSKKFMEAFKHKLQHGNHLQEQRVMLGIAKKIGLDSWNSEWYADFKSQYENGEKKLIEERLESLGVMGTPDRHRSIRASLLNNGTHDYDHWTNALSMLEKHGNLYAGGLQDLEGSWIFFKRIAGIPLSANVNDYAEFQSAVENIQKKGIDNITEEAVIEEYMKTNPHFQNSQIWRMVKKRVKEGTDTEFTNGGNEVEQFINLEQRLGYAMGKFESKEYAHGIGAMEKIFEKEGSAWKKQSIGFLLAMSRIPERLPRPILDKFIPMFDQWRTHSPSLIFIKDRSSQEKFRDAVRAIVEVKEERLIASWKVADGRQIRKDFDNMIEGISTNTEAYKKVDNFWKKYGKEIQYELTGNPKGSIMISETELKKRPALDEYKAMLTAQLGNTNIMNGVELDNGTPLMDGEAGSGVISFKPGKILDKMGLQIHHGGFSWSDLERALQSDFRASMEMIRDTKELSEEDKKAWFKNIYVEYVKKITATSNLTTFLGHSTVQPFNKLGLVPPLYASELEINAKILNLQKALWDIQLSIAMKKAELKRDTPAEKQKEINEAIIKKNQDAAELQRAIRETEGTRGQYVEYDERNADHQAHFNQQFQVFMKRANSTVTVRKKTANSVEEIIRRNAEPSLV